MTNVNDAGGAAWQTRAVGELGELLELLYGARMRFRTARGVVDYRHSNRLLQEAHRRQAARMNRRRGGGRTSMLQVAFASREGGDGAEPADVHVERVRFWWEPPERLREEVSSETRAQTRTTVLNGELWWTYSPEWGAISNVDLDDEERAQHGAGGGDRFRPLLDPSGLAAVLDFDQVLVAGDRLRVRARPREDLEGPPIHFHLHVVGGADAFELEVDHELGFVRRIAALIDGEELSVTELSEIAFDEVFPPETFVFKPPPGVEVLPPETGRHKRYTLEEAAEAAPFPVFFLPELPEGDWRLRVNYTDARRRPPVPANVWLIYHRADGRGALSLAQRPAREGGFGWPGYAPPELEQLERDGVPYTVCRADPDRGSQNAVAFERDGTAIQLQSQELELETLLELAGSLERVTASAR
jgi:outer membrane lipoprotein-sorting protein